MTIDVDALRQDLINYFGSAMTVCQTSVIDLIKVEKASDYEIVDIAIQNNFNLYDYEIKDKTR